jgi:hypothetical protein
MGRFYNTSNPDYIDYSYKLPVELMGKVIEKTDKEIDDANLLLSKLPSLLKADALEGVDKTRLSQYIQDKDTQISQMSKALIDNPLEARRYKSKIMDLANQITNDTSNGELGYLTKNKKTFDTWFEEQKKRMYGKDEYVTAEDIANKKAVLLKQWNESGGTGFTNGIGKSFNADPLTSATNLPKEALLIAKEVKPDEFSNMAKDKNGQWQPLGNTLFQSKDPAYLIKYGNQIKELNENKVTAAVYQNLITRPDVVNYYRQKVSDAQALGLKYTADDANAELVQAAKIAGNTVSFTEEKKTETLHANQRYIDDKNFQQDLFKMRLKNQYDIDAEERKAKKEKDELALGVVTPFGDFVVPTSKNLADIKTNLGAKRQDLAKLQTLQNDPKLTQAERNANLLNINQLSEQIKNNEEQLAYAGRSVTNYDMTKKYNEYKVIANNNMIPLGNGTSKPLTQLTNEDIGLMSKDRGNGLGATYKSEQLKEIINLKLMADNPETFANSFYTQRIKSTDFLPNITQSPYSKIVSPLTSHLASEEKTFTSAVEKSQPILKEEAMALIPVKGNDKESAAYRQMRGYLSSTVFKNISAFNTVNKDGSTTPIGADGKINIFNENGTVNQIKTSDVLAASDKSTVGMFKLDNKTVTVVKLVNKGGTFIGTAMFQGKDENQELTANSIYGTVAKDLQNSDDNVVRQYAYSGAAASEVSHIARGLNANKMSVGQSSSYTEGDFRYTTTKNNLGQYNLKIQGIDKNGNYIDVTDIVNKEYQKQTGNPKAEFNLKAANAAGLNKIIYSFKQLQGR